MWAYKRTLPWPQACLCGFTSKTSNQQLLSANWTKPQELSSNGLYELEKEVLLSADFYCFPSAFCACRPCLLSPHVDTHPLTDSLCGFLEGDLGRYDLHWCKWRPEGYWWYIHNPPISPIHFAFVSTRAACDLMTWYVWVIPQKASPSISNAIKQSQTIKDNIPIISMEIRNGMPWSTESLSLEWQLKTLLVQCAVFKICLMFFKLHIWHIILGWRLTPCWYLRQISTDITDCGGSCI